MKKLVILAAILIGYAATAQTVHSTNGNSIYGQLLKQSNVYSNAVYTDTVTNAATLTLGMLTAKHGAAYPIYNGGVMAIQVQGVTVSGKPLGGIYIQGSTDSIHWANTNYYTTYADTTGIDSATVTFSKTFYCNKILPYTRVFINQRGTAVVSYVSNYWYTKASNINLNK